MKIKNLIKNFFKIFGLLGIFQVACASPNYQLPTRFEKAQEHQYFQHRYVHIDPNFTADQQSWIIDSLNIWHDKTYGYVKWTLEPWPSNFWNQEVRSTEELETHHCSNHLLIFQSLSTDSLVVDLDFRVGHTITGYAQSTQDICGKDYFLLVTDRINSPREFRQITLHEAGHILGLRHNNKGQIDSSEKSIMSYQWMRTLDEPTDYDLHWLLTNVGF